MTEANRDIYLKNLESLKNASSGFGVGAEKSSAPSIDIEVSEARSGEKTLKWKGAYLHSRYDPIKEARQFAASFDAHGADTALIFAWGADYFLREILSRLGDVKKIFIFPMNMDLFYATLNYFDYTFLFRDPRITIITDSAAGLKRVVEGSDVEPFRIIHPASLKTSSVELVPLRDILEEGISSDFILARMEERKGEGRSNLEENWANYHRDPGVCELFGSEPGCTVVVAGAGPSLDGDIERLSLDSDPLVIAVDAAYPAMLKGGLAPDITVAIDSKPTVAAFLEGATEESTLLYRPMVAPEVLDLWKGKRYITFLSTDSGLTDEQERKGLLSGGGSVIHPAVDLADRLSAKRVILIGADFSYPGGKTHSEGVYYSSDAGDLPLGREVKATNGEMVMSSKNLIGYLRELERYIALHPDVQWVNLTGNGALIAGCETALIS